MATQTSKEKLTLKLLDEKINKLEDTIQSLVKIVKQQGTDNPRPQATKTVEMWKINIDTLENSNPSKGWDFEKFIVSRSENIVDDYGNVFVKLPELFLKLEDKNLLFSTTEFDGSLRLTPQLISKYKNSLDNGMIKSIPNVAPNFNQFSYNKSSKFCSWVAGEQLNWKTVLYIQIIWAFCFGTKETNKILPNENYNWDEDRDCSFSDTGNHIGEFLGIEQLFTSGRNFVDFSDYTGYKTFWTIFTKWNYTKNFDPTNKFGLWGDYGEDEESKSVFFSRWCFEFNFAWYLDFYAVRLCKAPF